MKTIISILSIFIVSAVLLWIGCGSDSGPVDPGGDGNGGNGGGEVDTLAPVVSITSPTDGATLSTSLTITGSPSTGFQRKSFFYGLITIMAFPPSGKSPSGS